MVHVLGSLCKLEPSEVTDDAINALKSVIEATPEEFLFDCELCGAERPANVIDPGVLIFKNYKCADVSARCKSPPTPNVMRRVVTFLPGSLVLAPIDPIEKTIWPGIIEDCPDGTGRHIMEGKTPDTVKAYFVTFIFGDSCERRWLGGYIDAKEIRPFEQPSSLRFKQNESIGDFHRALHKAYAALPLSLAERLLKLSFVAHVAASRDIQLRKDGPCFWWELASKRRSSTASPLSDSTNKSEKDVHSNSTKLPELVAEKPKENGENAEEDEVEQKAAEAPRAPRKGRIVSYPENGAEGPTKLFVTRSVMFMPAESSSDSE